MVAPSGCQPTCARHQVMHVVVMRPGSNASHHPVAGALGVGRPAAGARVRRAASAERVRRKAPRGALHGGTNQGKSSPLLLEWGQALDCTGEATLPRVTTR